jgi:hypothetical protein
MMESGQLQELLQKACGLRRRSREGNIFSTGARGYYEEPTSDLLAFFLNPSAEHGLGDLLLACLVDFLREPPFPLELEEPPIREYPTRDQNRIDLLLHGIGWVIAIENKIRHSPLNPFAEYRDTIQARFQGKRLYFVILSPYDPGQPGWTWVSYEALLAKAREKLGARLIAAGFSKWSIFFREFLIHLEDQVGRDMDDQQFNFVRDHYSQVREVSELHDRYIEGLRDRVESAARDLLGTEPYRVARNLWPPHGIALRVFPAADRQHNSTLLVCPDGSFRVQFYVQVDARQPNEADRAVFTDDGHFRYMGDESRGALWIFYRDEGDLDSAMNTFRTSLSVLRNHTQ